MALSPQARTYAYFYPAVQGAVSERAQTAEVFAAVRESVAQSGRPAPPGLWQAVNELRSAAVAERNYAALLAKSGPDAPVLGAQVPQAIFARSVDVQAVNPLLQADYQVTTRDQQGNVTTRWLTSFNIPFRDGMTVSDITDLVAQDAEAQAAGYGSTVEGDPVIGAVLAY